MKIIIYKNDMNIENLAGAGMGIGFVFELDLVVSYNSKLVGDFKVFLYNNLIKNV